MIGYLAPNSGATTNFVYGIGDIGTADSEDSPSGKVGWQAANLANLNECTMPSGAAASAKNSNLSAANWTVTLGYTAGANDLTFNSAANGPGCVALTPTFDKIGK